MNALHAVAVPALVLMVALPLLASVALLLARAVGDTLASVLASGAAGLTLLAGVLVALAAAPYDVPGPGVELDVAWVPALGLRLHLGVDGISAPLVLLTGLLGLLVCLHLLRDRPPTGQARGLLACVLAVQGGALATFTALDLLLFFVAFEVVLVPMWFAVAGWGDPGQARRVFLLGPARVGGEHARRDAANRFVLFTALGSAIMLLGLLLVAAGTGSTDVLALAGGSGPALGRSTQVLAATLITLGLAVKTPMWPLHTWLPPAHTIAPTAGSVLLAGVLLKMGTYGLVRIVLPVLPQGFAVIAPGVAVCGVIGILWGGLACLVERDLKRLVAFSSVAHMGFVLLGIASMTPTGVQGALFANVAHGLITGLLFLVVGGLKDRHHSADLVRIGTGLRDRMPRLGWLLAFGCLAGLGLPGLAGFWGEILAVTGSWSGGAALGGLARPLAVLAGVGTALAAAYLLRVLRLVWHGPAAGPARPSTAAGPAGAPAAARVDDATRYEVSVAVPLVLAVTALGLLPWLLLDVTGPAVRALLGSGPLVATVLGAAP